MPLSLRALSDGWLVEARLRDPGLRIVVDYDCCHTIVDRKRMRVRADAVGEPLREARLRVGVDRCSEHCDEQLRGPRLTGRAVDYLKGRSGIVDKQPLISPAKCVCRIVGDSRTFHS